MPTDNGCRVGIWLEIPPQTSLAGEGIYRVLMKLVQALADRGDTTLVFAVPTWAKPSLQLLLHEQRIRRDAYEFVTSRRRIPLVVRLRSFLARNRAPGQAPKMLQFVKAALAKVWHVTGAPQALTR